MLLNFNKSNKFKYSITQRQKSKLFIQPLQRFSAGHYLTCGLSESSSEQAGSTGRTFGLFLRTVLNERKQLYRGNSLVVNSEGKTDVTKSN